MLAPRAGTSPLGPGQMEPNKGMDFDSGSPILSRIVNYYPSWAEKYIFLDIGYWAPGQLSTRANVTASQDTLGYKMFFNENGTGYVLDKHVSSQQSSATATNGCWETDER